MQSCSLYKIGTILLITIIVARTEPPLSSTYGVPSAPAPFSSGYPASGGSNGGGYGGSNGGSSHGHYDEHDHYESQQPKSYEFGYAVKDDYSGNDYGRKESSDGNTVHGEYRVNLPDGRVQIVTYYADWQTGFHADVRYEGEAVYPQVYKTYGPPSPQYGAPAAAAPSSQYGPPQGGGYPSYPGGNSGY